MFIVEVQHTSDFQQDGVWHELERTASAEHAAKLLRYFGVKEPAPKGIRPEQCRLTGSYEGRPLRYRPLRAAGDHGTHEDALAFALDAHDDTLQTYEFLLAWREGALDEWPEFYEWLNARQAVTL